MEEQESTTQILKRRITRRKAIKAGGVATTGPIHAKPKMQSISLPPTFASVTAGPTVTLMPTPTHTQTPPGLGPWTQQAKLTASGGAPFDGFWRAVVISEVTALFEVLADDDQGTNSGSAYVYVCSGATWSRQAKLPASDGANGDIYGVSVAISADIAVVGAPSDGDKGRHSLTREDICDYSAIPR